MSVSHPRKVISCLNRLLFKFMVAQCAELGFGHHSTQGNCGRPDCLRMTLILHLVFGVALGPVYRSLKCSINRPLFQVNKETPCRATPATSTIFA